MVAYGGQPVRLMIADDEQMTRESLWKLIPWSSLGIDEVVLACDGKDALDIAARNTPDILLTDVRMPLIDGIELAHFFARLYPQCRVLFLSGYSEKEYLVNAIKLKASAYIEKPIDPEEVVSAVMNAVREVQEDQSRERQEHEHVSLLATSFAWNLLSGNFSQALRDSEKMNVSHTVAKWIAASAYVGNPDERESLYAFLRPWNRKGKLYTCVSDGFVQVLTADDGITAAELLSSCVQQLGVLLNIGTSVGQGGLKEASCAMNNSVKAARNAFFFGYDLIGYETLSETPFEPPAMPLGPLTHPDETAATIMQTCKYFRASRHLMVSSVRDALYCMADALVRDALRHRISPHPLSLEPSELWAWVNRHQTLDEVEEDLIEIVHKLSAPDEGSSHIREALRFIDANLGDHNLSLTWIADHLNLNASYLSTLFKEDTNRTVVNYITEKRMDRAKLLLSEGNAKTQSVAQLVGYADTAWFIKRYKQAFGMTPNEYKEKGRR